MTYTEIGALTGFVTFLFTVFDRLIRGRPTTSIGRALDANKNFRDLVCTNFSRHDLVLTSITTWPKWAQVLADDTIHGTVRSAMGESFTALIAPAEAKRFPIVIRRGELLDDGCTERGLFFVLVYWRKTRAAWLPQIPALVISSAASLRQIGKAK